MIETEEQGRMPAEGEISPGPERPRSSRGVWIAIIVLLILAGVVISGIIPREKAKAALRTETYDLAIPTVSVMHPKMGSPQTEIVLPGNIQAFSDSPIYARTNGYLKKWYADIGTHVKAGDLLADIEAPEIDQQLSQAQAQLATSQANMKLAEITMKRDLGMMKGAIPQQDIDNTVGAYEADKATVDSQSANVKYLEQLVAFQKVVA